MNESINECAVCGVNHPRWTFRTFIAGIVAVTWACVTGFGQ